MLAFEISGTINPKPHRHVPEKVNPHTNTPKYVLEQGEKIIL
jgi:hypothetical protein